MSEREEADRILQEAIDLLMSQLKIYPTEASSLTITYAPVEKNN